MYDPRDLNKELDFYSEYNRKSWHGKYIEILGLT